MANPQPEPFVKFSKELFDALLLSPMPATHKEVVLAVIRRTYGDHGRKSAPISHALIRRMTGRADSGIRKSMSALVEEGVLVLVQSATFSSPAIWQLNKDYETWGRWSVQSATTVAEGQDVAEGEHGDTGECHHGGRGECHHGGTMEDLIDLETPPEGANAPRSTPSTTGKDPKKANELVALYVDAHAALGRTPPDKRRRGQFATAVSEQLHLGATPWVLRAAVKRLVERAQPPSNLGLMVQDVERDGNGHRPLSDHAKRLAQLRDIPPEAREFFCRQHGWGDEWMEVIGGEQLAG